MSTLRCPTCGRVATKAHHIITLAHDTSLTDAEIAKRTGSTVNSVKVALSRAKRAGRLPYDCRRKTYLNWCPPKFKDTYRMARRKGLSREESRALVEREIERAGRQL